MLIKRLPAFSYKQNLNLEVKTMKKLVSIISAILVIASMSTVAMAADVEPVYPNGGKDTVFSGETAGKEVKVGLAYDDNGSIIEIDDWDLQDGYAVDITWSDLSFLYVINGEDETVTTRYVSKWDPDELRWVLWDTQESKEVIDLEGKYDDSALAEFQGRADVKVTDTTQPVTNKNLGVNGFAVTNRSSQPIDVSYSYTQSEPLYDNPVDALVNKGGNIPAVYGQVGGNDSEATLSTLYSYLKTPDNAPVAPGVCGTITITIG